LNRRFSRTKRRSAGRMSAVISAVATMALLWGSGKWCLPWRGPRWFAPGRGDVKRAIPCPSCPLVHSPADSLDRLDMLDMVLARCFKFFAGR
jgi:hypothetical protein